MESTTQPLHLSNESCLVDSYLDPALEYMDLWSWVTNNTAATVKKQHYHSVTYNSAGLDPVDG